MALLPWPSSSFSTPRRVRYCLLYASAHAVAGRHPRCSNAVRNHGIPRRTVKHPGIPTSIRVSAWPEIGRTSLSNTGQRCVPMSVIWPGQIAYAQVADAGALSTDQMVVLVRRVQSVSVSDETAERQAWVNQDQHYRVKQTAVIRPPLLQLHGGSGCDRVQLARWRCWPDASRWP
jgi:hypothetical protein